MSAIVALALERRVFFVGVNTGYVTDGLPDKRFVRFYALRSSPLLYCAIVGNVVIPDGYASNHVSPAINSTPIWCDIASAIKDRGSIPGIQLASAWIGYQGEKSFRSPAGDTVISKARELVKTFGAREISDLFRRLNQATALALEAGFQHIQLHAAHGYLFNLLIDRRIFDGADDVMCRICNWAASATRDGAETSIRVSLRSGDDQFDKVGTAKFQSDISKNISVDLIDVSSGYYNIDKRLIYPARPEILESRRKETIEFARLFPERRFIASGRMAPMDADELPPNIDIGLCRDLIANPDFLYNSHKGCTNRGKCHYYSRGAPHITCGNWDSSDYGNE